MPAYEISDDERAALIRLLRETIEADRFPLSPRIKQLTVIRDKLDPAPAKPELLPPLKSPGEQSLAQRRRQRRR